MESVRSLANNLDSIKAAVRDAAERTFEAAGDRLVAAAQARIGSESNGWPPLAATTAEEKRRLGYTGQVSATDPLLRTGELRDSYHATADADGVTLGSDDPVAAWQENGTAKIPPRPVIAPVMRAQAEAIARELGANVAEAIRDALRR